MKHIPQTIITLPNIGAIYIYVCIYIYSIVECFGPWDTVAGTGGGVGIRPRSLLGGGEHDAAQASCGSFSKLWALCKGV